MKAGTNSSAHVEEGLVWQARAGDRMEWEVGFWEIRVKSCGEMDFTINSCTCSGQGEISAFLAINQL